MYITYTRCLLFIRHLYYIVYLIISAEAFLAQRDVTAPWLSTTRQRGCKAATVLWGRQESDRRPRTHSFPILPQPAHLLRRHSAREPQWPATPTTSCPRVRERSMLHAPTKQEFGILEHAVTTYMYLEYAKFLRLYTFIIGFVVVAIIAKALNKIPHDFGESGTYESVDGAGAGLAESDEQRHGAQADTPDSEATPHDRVRSVSIISILEISI